MRIPTTTLLTSVAALAFALTGCSGSATPSPTASAVPSAAATPPPSSTPAAADPTPSAVASGPPYTVAVESDLVWLTDEEGDWKLSVFYPEAPGPWPLIVTLPPRIASIWPPTEMAKRGAVVVQPDAWTIQGWIDPAPHLYGEMDRAACAVGWAQAHAADYGADAAATTIDGYSGGAMVTAWVGLGLADDTTCPFPMTALPVGLVVGENQVLFHHERWDPSFSSGDPEPKAILDGLLNPERWVTSPHLKVALWSATHPIAETRTVENPPGPDSWLWLRDGATPVVDDLIAVGALDDGRIDWGDNARLLESRMQTAGVDVRNETFDIGHAYAPAVYDLIFSIQP